MDNKLIKIGLALQKIKQSTNYFVYKILKV